jgi:hypothetical protein
MVRVSGLGNAYLQQTQEGLTGRANESSITRHASGPLVLSLVGFSEKTTRVGFKDSTGAVRVIILVPLSEENQSIGSMVGELVSFRSAVRQAALKDARPKHQQDGKFLLHQSRTSPLFVE